MRAKEAEQQGCALACRDNPVGLNLKTHIANTFEDHSVTLEGISILQKNTKFAGVKRQKEPEHHVRTTIRLLGGTKQQWTNRGANRRRKGRESQYEGCEIAASKQGR